MSALRSPYTPGSGTQPRTMAGRADLLADIHADLTWAASSGEAASQPTILTGERGLGKTVLLDHVTRQSRHLGLLTAHATMDRSDDAVQRIAAAVGEALPGSHANRSLRERLTARLAEFSIELSAPGFARISSRWNPRSDDAVGARSQLAALLADSAQLAREERGTGLVLTLDELQECPPQSLAAIAHALQDTARQRAPLSVYGAGLRHTPEALMAAASFTERYEYVRLDRLELPESRLALVEPALALGVHWSPPAAEHVLREAAGSPFLIQLYGDKTWRAARPTGPGEFTLDHARAGALAAERSLHQGMFRGRWEIATAGEQRLLVAIAACLDETGTAPVQAVADFLGHTQSRISAQRRRLIDKGLIEDPVRGRLGFTMPGFERFALEQAVDPEAGR